MKIAKWNIRGIIDKDKQKNLLEDLTNYNIDILTIQETHIRNTSKLELGGKYTLYHTGPKDHSHHGVGIVVKNQYKGIFKPINDRICQLDIELEKNNKLTVISAYAPTLTKSEKKPELADNFYKELQNTINLIPNRNFLFLGIDSNAQLGTGKFNIFPDNVGNFGKGHLNSNGERLGNLLSSNNLIATNTFFDHKIKHRVTWNHPNQNPNFIDKRSGKKRINPIRNQIDFIITPKKLKPIIQDSRSYQGTKTESDHNIVICKCKIEPFRIYKEKNKSKPIINLNYLKSEVVQKEFQEDIYKNIGKIENTNWKNVAETLKNSAKNVIGESTKNRNNITNDKIKELSREQLKLKLDREACQNRDKRKAIQNKRNRIKKLLKKELKKERENEELERIKIIENSKNDSRRMFQAVRTLNRKEDNTILVENSKGEIIHNTEEELKEITKYFENIFKKEQIHPIPKIPPKKLEEEITCREVKEAVDKLKNNKSPGCDDIRAELLKNSPDIIYKHIAEILNQIAETGNKPIELSLGQLIPLPKPGKPKGPVKNLRPIILLSILRKILAIIVIDRTFETIRKEIKNTQAAYSPGRSTTELVFTFKTLIEQAVCAEDLTIHLILLDMSRAFDTIERGILLEDLKELLEPDILHLVNLLLTDVQIQVKYKNKIGETFKPNIGSPQGDCASPIWFIFYLHKALQTIKSPQIRDIKKDTKHDHNYTKLDKKVKIDKNQKEYLIDQQYADDISWITTNKNAKEYIKNTVPNALTDKNLLVNPEKTEEYSINRTSNQDWKNCKYLGSLLGDEEDIKRRKLLACDAFRKNKKCLT